MIEDAVIIWQKNSGKKILGLPILLRAILAGEQAGLKNFLILGWGTSEESKLIETIKKDIRIKSRQLTINYLSLFELTSSSLPLSSDLSKKNFWLITGDLIFSPKILEEYRELKGDLPHPLIFSCCAKNSSNSSESSSDWSGLALCPGPSWSSLVMALAKTNPEADIHSPAEIFSEFSFHLLEQDDHFLIRVRNKIDEKKAIRALLGTARKPQDGFIARHFNRHISLFFTRHLIKFGLTPSALSFLNFLIGIIGALITATGKNYWTFFGGAFLFEFSSIFDGCDGEVARLTYRTSKKGASLDVVFDALTYFLFFSSLAIGLYRRTKASYFLIWLTIFLLSLVWYYFNLIRYTRASGIGNKIFLVAKEVEERTEQEKKLNFFDRLASKLAFAVRRDFFATFVFLMIAAGLADFTLYLVIGGSLLESTYFHFYTTRRLKQLKASQTINSDLSKK